MPERFSPVRLFVTLLALIFCIEMAMMLALHYLFANGTSVWAEAIADATVLTAVTSVFVWRLFMRPLRFALMSETAQAKAVMDAAAEGIITVDERGRIESFNHAAQRMFGYEAAEALGKNVKMLMPEPHASNHDGYIARYLRTGEARILGRPRELTALRRDASGFPIELNLTEIRLGGTRRFTAIIRDITERKQAQERIERLANYDSLTGVPTRALFFDRLHQAVNLARRGRSGLALLYIDLDKFKAVNDTLGHDVGDELLKSVAGRIRRRIRESDTVARLGGDEFTVILPKIPGREDAAVVAGKIIDALSAPFFLGGQKHEVRVGASIGIAVFPADTGDADALVKAADVAMYKAKQAGNSFRFYAVPAPSGITPP